MAASSRVGSVSSYVIKTSDNLGNDKETTISNKRIFVNPMSTYEQANTLSRALIALTTNTYNDTLLITNMSVNEQIYD